MDRPRYTRYSLRLTAATAPSPDAGVLAAAASPDDDWSGAAAYHPGPDAQALEYTDALAVEAILALQPAGWQEEDGGRKLVFWLEDGAEADAEVAEALKRIGSLGRLEVRREPPGWEIGVATVPQAARDRAALRAPALVPGTRRPARHRRRGRARLRHRRAREHAPVPRAHPDAPAGVAPGPRLRLGRGLVRGAPARVRPGDRHRDRPSRRARGRRQRGHERPRPDLPRRRRHRPGVPAAVRRRRGGQHRAPPDPAAGGALEGNRCGVGRRRPPAGAPPAGAPPAASDVSSPPSELLLSGLLVEQADKVLAAYPRFAETARVDDGTWLTLHLSRRT